MTQENNTTDGKLTGKPTDGKTTGKPTDGKTTGKSTGKSTHPRKISLLAGMVLIVIVCWVLPFILLLVTFNHVSTQNVTRNVNQLIQTSVENAAETVATDLEDLIQDSFRVNQSGVLRTALATYLHNTDATQNQRLVTNLTNTANQVLNQEFARKDDLRSVMINMLDAGGGKGEGEGEGVDADVGAASEESLSFYTYNPIHGSIGDVNYYERHVLPQVLELSPNLGNNVRFLNVDGHVYFVRNLVSFITNYEPYAVMAVEIIPERVAAVFDTLSYTRLVELSVDQTTLMTDRSLTAEQGQPGGESPDLGLFEVNGSWDTSRFSLSYHVLSDPAELLSQEREWSQLIVGLLFLLIPLTAVVIIFFHRQVTRPIKELTTMSNQVEEGKFGVQTDVDRMGSREFADLAGNFNTMSTKLQNQFERIYREEITLRDAKLKTLQSQINPHFLGNTLETINWQARLQGDTEISKMLEALSTMLKATTDRKEEPFITLAEELRYTDAYLTIIRQRLGQRLQVHQEIDPELLTRQLPRLILQPIVENAVEHGAFRQQNSTITIRARAIDDDWFTLEVLNDRPLSPQNEARIAALLGSGGEADSAAVGKAERTGKDERTGKAERAGKDERTGQAEKTSSVNIGIRNVNERLHLYFGEENGLTIRNDDHGNTISTLRIRRSPVWHDLADS